MQPSDDTDLALDLLEAVADHRGVDVADLEFVLHDMVDTGALNTLSRHDGGEWSLSLSVDGHTVTVDSDGLILVDGEEPTGSENGVQSQ